MADKRETALQPAGVPKMYGDVPPFMAMAYAPDLKGARADAIVLGMPFDGIATYRGGATRRAPQEIRKFSLLFGGYNFDWDMDTFAHLEVLDCGDIDVAPGRTAESYIRLERRVDEIQAAGAVPLMLGGDHGVTYPAVKAVARKAGAPMGVIVFDTHLDLSEHLNGDRLTRASPVKRICELPEIDPRRVVMIGIKGPRNVPEWTPLYKSLGMRVYSIAEVAARGMAAVAEEALRIASPDGRLPYVSVDIDAVDPAFAPGTNSPEPGGLTSREIIEGVRIVCREGFTGFDVVEVSPDFDSESGTTSLLAARLVCEAMCCLAARRAGRVDGWRFKP
ncbi:MAG: agmatinase [Alphaproteobacteria bacterium]